MLLDGLLVEPEDGQHITHLLVRKGHLWDQKDVTIPISQIDHMERNTVYLKIDKRTIASLPSVPTQRGWSKP